MTDIQPSGAITPAQIASFQNAVIASVNTNAKSLNTLSQQLEVASSIIPHIGNRYAIHLKGETAVYSNLYVVGNIYLGGEILPLTGLPE